MIIIIGLIACVGLRHKTKKKLAYLESLLVSRKEDQSHQAGGVNPSHHHASSQRHRESHGTRNEGAEAIVTPNEPHAVEVIHCNAVFKTFETH
jgi:hypothetical protein